jgi:hypothetical protein
MKIDLSKTEQEIIIDALCSLMLDITRCTNLETSKSNKEIDQIIALKQRISILAEEEN